MNGKELLLKAIRGETTPRPAWLPFVGVHGAYLINAEAPEYLQSSELIVRGLKKAIELYQPDGLPIAFDLQIEAEILGCKLQWSSAVPPAVITHPLAEGIELANLPVLNETKGRFPEIVKAINIMKRDHGNDIALYGLICGPFTLALHLLGNDIFMGMMLEPDRVQEIVHFCGEVGKKAADIYIDHGIDVVAVVDPMTSQISPEHFAEFVAPAVNTVFDHIRTRKAYSSIFVCGDVTRNLEALCKTTADNVSVDEQIPIPAIRDAARSRNKSFGGNIKLTAVLLLGDEDDSRKETIGIIDDAGTSGFILSPGCDLPFNVPSQNLQAVADMIRDAYKREVARTAVALKKADTFDDICIPDYGIADGVVVDVITLDSTSCAPCQYMMEAVEKAAKAASVKVFINEHKIKVRSGIGMMVKLGVKNLPTICINGEIFFASIIPDQDTLVKAFNAKGAR